MVIIFRSCPRNLLQHGTGHMKPEEPWGTMRNPNAQNYTTVEKLTKTEGKKRKAEKKIKTEKLPPWTMCVCEICFSYELPARSVNAGTLARWEAPLGVDTHMLYSSSGRWWWHEVNIITAESTTGGSHERSLIFSCKRDTWFILFSRKADNAPMKISGGFQHHYCSPHTIFKCILDYVAM